MSAVCINWRLTAVWHSCGRVLQFFGDASPPAPFPSYSTTEGLNAAPKLPLTPWLNTQNRWSYNIVTGSVNYISQRQGYPIQWAFK